MPGIGFRKPTYDSGISITLMEGSGADGDGGGAGGGKLSQRDQMQRLRARGHRLSQCVEIEIDVFKQYYTVVLLYPGTLFSHFL